jgi:integrase
MTDGRWRIIGTQIRFSEANEQRAIAKFNALTKSGTDRAFSHPEVKEVNDRLARASIANEDPKMLWGYFADQLDQRPQWVAEMTGHEKLAYLPDLKPPKPLPTFDALEKLWNETATCQREEKRKVLADWKYFVKDVGIAGLRDITPETVVAFRNRVYARNLKGKTQQHIFNHIRRMLSFAKMQALNIPPEITTALELLTPNATTVSLNPEPIKVAEFKKILEAVSSKDASGKDANPDDKALVLLCLNAALYLQEAMDLQWSDITDHGCLIAHRQKTGQCLRVAVLWKETLDALAAIKRKGKHVFYANTGAPLTVSGAGKRWRKLRKAAGLETLKANQLRDGAATAMAVRGIHESICKVVLGHRGSGMTDNYVLRNPRLVQPACDAIYTEYFS